MQQVENLVYKSSSQQLNTCDLEFIECEWIYQSNDEPPHEVERELHVDLEKPTQKG